MNRHFVGRRLRPVLSTTDLLLLLVLVILMQAHLFTAITGSLVALLFAVQHGIGAVVLLAHRPASQVSSRPWDTALGWAGTRLPLAMRATTELAGLLSWRSLPLAVCSPGPRSARWAAASAWSRRTVGCRHAGSTRSCATRSTPPTC